MASNYAFNHLQQSHRRRPLTGESQTRQGGDSGFVRRCVGAVPGLQHRGCDGAGGRAGAAPRVSPMADAQRRDCEGRARLGVSREGRTVWVAGVVGRAYVARVATRLSSIEVDVQSLVGPTGLSAELRGLSGRACSRWSCQRTGSGTRQAKVATEAPSKARAPLVRTRLTSHHSLHTACDALHDSTCAPSAIDVL